MPALFSLLIIILLSVIACRIGATALELTGLSPEIASFQAQSAFSGVGFTTREAEMIVSHPVRRRIVRVLILLGSAGVTTSMATLVIAFVGQSKESFLFKAEVLFAGVLAIFVFARSRMIYRVMKRIITYGLEHWTRLPLYDYEQMFGLSEGHAIARVVVGKDNWMSGRHLRDLKDDLQGVLILAIDRRSVNEKHFIGAPHGDTMIKSGDALICYARKEQINKILSRKHEKVNAAHASS
jgi:hypothetical protein